MKEGCVVVPFLEPIDARSLPEVAFLNGPQEIPLCMKFFFFEEVFLGRVCERHHSTSLSKRLASLTLSCMFEKFSLFSCLISLFIFLSLTHI